MLTYRCPGCGKSFADATNKVGGHPVCPGCQRILTDATPEATTEVATDQTTPDGALYLLLPTGADSAAPPIRRFPRWSLGRKRPAKAPRCTPGLNLDDIWQEQQAARQRRRVLLLSLSGIALVCCVGVAVLNWPASKPPKTVEPTPIEAPKVADRPRLWPSTPLPQHDPDDESREQPAQRAKPFHEDTPLIPPSESGKTPGLLPRAPLPRIGPPLGVPPRKADDKPAEIEDPKMAGKVPPPLHVNQPTERADHDSNQQSEEIDPDVQAQIRADIQLLHQHAAADRIRGVKDLGTLGAKARSAAREICVAMVDPNRKVDVAAAGALKEVNSQLYHLAVPLIVNAPDYPVLLKTLRRVTDLGPAGRALTPIVVRVLSAYCLPGPTRRGNSANALQAQIVAVACIRTLTAIARNDFDGVQAVLALLSSHDAQIRYAAVCAVPSLKQAQPGAKALILIAQSDRMPEARLAAITALVSVADDDNRASIKACLDGLTLDRDPAVRQAAETALDRLARKLGRPEARDVP